MRYLGKISGSGVLKCNGEEIARASYDFDEFFKEPAGVTSCGEIRLSATVLQDVFGHKDVQLLTDNGRLFNLRFSEKKLLPGRATSPMWMSQENCQALREIRTIECLW